MIFTQVDLSFPLFRALAPRWAMAPLSGAGAALRGGRLNRPGVNALYLSASVATAAAEYQQDEPLMPPCTMASYQAQLGSVVDFRSGYVPGSWDPLWQELYCNWRGESMYDGREPASWVLSDWIQDAGGVGVLYPSFRAEGVNLVVYTDSLASGDRLDVFDPDGRLPQDQASWKS